MPFNFSVDNGVWTEADLAGDAYAYRMITFLKDLLSVNHSKNVAVCSTASIGTGSVVLTLSERAAVDFFTKLVTDFRIGSPVVIGRPNVDPLQKPLLRYGTVTATGTNSLTVNVTFTNGVTDAATGIPIWYITPWQAPFALTGVISSPGGTGQTTAVAARKALKILRPTDGFEQTEDFIGFSPTVTSAASSQAYLNRFFAACANGGTVSVNGHFDGYDYDYQGSHPGVALLSCPNGGDVAGVALGSAPHIHFGGSVLLRAEFSVYVPKVPDTNYVLALGLYARNSGAAFRTFLNSTAFPGSGLNVILSDKRINIGGTDLPGVYYQLNPAINSAGFLNATLPGWNTVVIESSTTLCNVTLIKPDYSQESVSGSLSGASTTSLENWLAPFVKLINLNGKSEAWAMVDFMTVRGEANVAR